MNIEKKAINNVGVNVIAENIISIFFEVLALLFLILNY